MASKDSSSNSSRPSKSLLISATSARRASYLCRVEAGVPLFVGTFGDPHVKLAGGTRSEVRLALYVDDKRGGLMLSDVLCRFPVLNNGRRLDYAGQLESGDVIRPGPDVTVQVIELPVVIENGSPTWAVELPDEAAAKILELAKMITSGRAVLAEQSTGSAGSVDGLDGDCLDSLVGDDRFRNKVYERSGRS